MHVSIHWDTGKGVKPANKTFDYVDLAFDYISKVQKMLGDKASPAIVMLHQRNHDDVPTVLYTIDQNGIPFMDGDQWIPSSPDSLQLVGDLEFQSDDGEWIHWTVCKTNYHLVFGSVCNTGLMQSGSYLLDSVFSLDDHLSDLLGDLQCIANGEPASANTICNQYM